MSTRRRRGAAKTEESAEQSEADQVDAVESDGERVARLETELAELQVLADQLAGRVEQLVECSGETQDLPLEFAAEVLKLVTVLGPIRAMNSAPPQPSKVDPYVEDLADPEFGLRPARRVIMQAAEHILHGYDAFRLPTHPRRRTCRPGLLSDLDE